MALEKFSGAQLIPLSTGSNDNPTLTQGAETTFRLGGVDPLDGDKARYTPGVILTIVATLTQSGGTGVRLSALDLYRALISYVEVRNSFFGFPLRSTRVTGALLPWFEFIQSGYGFWSPKRSFIPAANGANAFVLPIFIPINYFGPNADDQDTMQLVAAYSEATLAIGVAASSVLTAMSPGATFGTITAKASMVAQVDKEVRLAPGIEPALYLAPFSSGAQIDFQAVGDDTGFSGVEKGAGFLAASLMTNARGGPGAFAGNQITAFGIPWRGQRRTTDLDPIIAAAWAAAGNHGVIGSAQDAGTSQGLSDFSRLPHLYTTGADPTGALANANLVAFPVIPAGRRLQLSNAQKLQGNLPLLAEFSGGSGTHTLAAIQAKRWTPDIINAYTAKLLQLGIPQAVLKTSSVKWDYKLAQPRRRANLGKAGRYLPLVLQPAGA